jgi:Ca-activated chloride channel family protein
MNLLKIFVMLIVVAGLSSAASTILVLDASGSMDYSVSGSSKTKIEVAKDAANTLLNNIPYGDEVALVVFYDCNDIRTVVDYTTDMQTIKNALIPIQPDSSTPISGAIDYAANYASTSGKYGSSIIVLTDGEETCDSQSDAVASAQTAVAGGIKIINVVGFDIQGSTAATDLQAIATAGGGQYYPADNANQLSSSLQQAYYGNNNYDYDDNCCAPAAMMGLVLLGAFYIRRN